MQESIHKLLQRGMHPDPHSVLGLVDSGENKQIIRVWNPGAKSCKLEILGVLVEVQEMFEGIYEYEVDRPLSPTDYHIFHRNGTKAHDPYAFDKLFGELDIHLLARGLHYEMYDLLGATPKIHQGVEGIQFAVWAPNARAVSLIGAFNDWDGRWNPMRKIDSIGVWELFIPGLTVGEKYKFEIGSADEKRIIKADPVAHFFEKRPKNSSVVFDVNRYKWSDRTWLQNRGKFRATNTPVNIYEVHLGSWKLDGGAFKNYRQLAKELVEYCKLSHFTHVELIGVCEHPLDESWGYQVTGYFAPTSRFGTPEDFQYFVDYLHAHDLGVIVDWVPAHFPTDAFAIGYFDGTNLYEHSDTRKGFHPQWNTHIFNYGRWEVSNFLIASALFWLEKMHVDGLRVDAVSSMLYLDYERGPGEWTPNRMGSNIHLEAVEFIKHMNSIIHEKFPDVLMIAEESHAYPGVTKEVAGDGLGFDLKWNLGWMSDTLSFFSLPLVERAGQMERILKPTEYVFDEKSILVLSHDEVVHEKGSLLEKMPGSEVEKMASLRLLLSYLYCFPGKKLLFMGGEIGQKTEWNCKDEIDWELLKRTPHAQLSKMVAAMGKFYGENGALFEQEFDRACFEKLPITEDRNAVFGYLRKGCSQTLLCLHHFLPNAVEGFSIPLEGIASIKEVFNTDSEQWGGSGIMNPSIDIRKSGVRVNVAPLATQIFSLEYARNE